jgi:heme/copper-type cytochrome/quinol oxidase subunit 2
MVPAEDLSENSLRLLETTNPVILPYKTYIKVCVTASDVIHS